MRALGEGIRGDARVRSLFQPRSFAGGRVQVFGCSPGCLIVSLLASIILTILLNVFLNVL